MMPGIENPEVLIRKGTKSDLTKSISNIIRTILAHLSRSFFFSKSCYIATCKQPVHYPSSDRKFPNMWRVGGGGFKSNGCQRLTQLSTICRPANSHLTFINLFFSNNCGTLVNLVNCPTKWSLYCLLDFWLFISKFRWKEKYSSTMCYLWISDPSNNHFL